MQVFAAAPYDAGVATLNISKRLKMHLLTCTNCIVNLARHETNQICDSLLAISKKSAEAYLFQDPFLRIDKILQAQLLLCNKMDANRGNIAGIQPLRDVLHNHQKHYQYERYAKKESRKIDSLSSNVVTALKIGRITPCTTSAHLSRLIRTSLVDM